MTAQFILTNEFFTLMSERFLDISDSELYSTISDWIYANNRPLVNQSKIKYGDVPILDELSDMTVEEIAEYVSVNIADGFARIFNSIMIDYNPYENYFTEREMKTNVDRDNTKTGSIETTPTGAAITETNGERNRTFNGYENVGQATTFEEYGDNDFKNVSKNKTDGTIKDNYLNYGTTTKFNNYKVTQNYNNLNDSTTGKEDVSENRHGSSGIFSKQELFKREISNRLNFRLMPIFLAMVVGELESGVYYAS